jgi:hypothetical protein
MVEISKSGSGEGPGRVTASGYSTMSVLNSRLAQILAMDLTNVPRSRHEIQSSSQVQNQVPSEQLGRIRPSPRPARRYHSLDFSREEAKLPSNRRLETGPNRNWTMRGSEEVLRSRD